MTPCALRSRLAALLAVAAFGFAGLQPSAEYRVVPSDIEGRIASAFDHALRTGDFGALDAEARLLALPPGVPAGRMRCYWNGLLHYRLAVALVAKGQLGAAEKAVGKSVAALEKIEPPDSESRALHALAAGMALGFAPPEAMFAAVGPVVESLAEALRLDPENPRAHYANAIAVYRMPAEHGDDERIDQFLSKALAGFAAADRRAERVAEPSWGHGDAIGLAISHHLRQNRIAAAADLYAEAQVLFPDSAILAAFEDSP